MIRINAIYRLKTLFLLAFLCSTAAGLSNAAGAADVAQVNLILDSGVVLIYKGADYGFRKGDKLNVLRDGQTIGSLEVTDVYPTFTRANILNQSKTIEVFDVVSISGEIPAQPLPEKKPKEEKPAPPKEEKKPAAKEAKKEEKKPAEKEAKKEEKKPAEKTAKKEEKKPEEKKPEEKKPATVTGMPDTYYNVTLGYFYLNQDLGVGHINQPPALTYGVDYWKKMNRKTRLVGSLAFAKPKIRIPTSGAPLTLNSTLYYLSANYVIDEIGKEKTSTGNFYYGLGAAYRNLNMNLAAIRAAGIPIADQSSTGIDFHALLGYRFDKNMEFKLLYSLDEGYYSLAFVYGFR